MTYRLSRLTLALALVGVTACGTAGPLFPSEDASIDGTVVDGSPSDGSSNSDSLFVFSDAGIDVDTDATCAFGSAGSFATQSDLNLFGDTVYFADGGVLPSGHYEITYVDGCMKYNATQDWTVNAYDSGVEDAGDFLNRHWYLVDGPGGQPGTTAILSPPGTAGVFSTSGPDDGAFSAFSDCVAANLKADAGKEFDFDGGRLGLYLYDNPYDDNMAGENNRNPKWSLSRSGPCPSPH